MAKDINKLIENFKQSKTVKALDNYLSEMSMMEILGVDRDENAHSNFLAWLFGNEVTGKEACRLLIELLKRETKQKAAFPQTFLNLSIKNVQVIREDFVCSKYIKEGETIRKINNNAQEIKGRADLLININDGKAYIVIENKVLSEEECKWCSIKEKPGELPKKEELKDAVVKTSLWQTQFYEDYYSALEPYKDKTLFAFLTLPGKEKAKSENFIHVTYQDIMDSILVHVLGSLALSHHSTEKSRITEYIKALGIRYSQDEVMAVDPCFRGLLTSLNNEFSDLYNPEMWKKDDETLKRLIEFWNSSTCEGMEVRDILRPAIKALSALNMTKTTEDTKGTTYQYKVKESEIVIGGKNALFKWFVEQYISKHHDANIEALQLSFPAFLHRKNNSIRDTKLTNNHIVINSPKNRYSEIDKKIYICQTGWDGPAMMSRLIKYVKENIPELKDIEILEIPEFLHKK